jgi:hypothetical protein
MPRFFQDLLYISTNRYGEQYNEFINFAIYELFFYTITFLIRLERFEEATELICFQYRDKGGDIRGFGYFSQLNLDYFSATLSSTLNVRVNHTRPFLLHKRAENCDSLWNHLREVDFILLWRSTATYQRGDYLSGWDPVTFDSPQHLLERGEKFDFLNLAQSKRYFERFKVVLNFQDSDEVLGGLKFLFPEVTEERRDRFIEDLSRLFDPRKVGTR